jgi:hypothetical protein
MTAAAGTLEDRTDVPIEADGSRLFRRITRFVGGRVDSRQKHQQSCDGTENKTAASGCQ